MVCSGVAVPGQEGMTTPCSVSSLQAVRAPLPPPATFALPPATDHANPQSGVQVKAKQGKLSLFFFFRTQSADFLVGDASKPFRALELLHAPQVRKPAILSRPQLALHSKPDRLLPLLP